MALDFPNPPLTPGQTWTAGSGVIYRWDGTVWTAGAVSGGGGGAVDPASLGYRHVQTTPATVWAITHALTFRPNVAAIDSTGREMIPGAVDYPSATTVTLTFSAAVGGEAYLS